MISNERPSPFYRQPYRRPYQEANQGQYQPHGYQQQPRPQVQEDTLKTIDLQIERKSFRLALKENSRGRFLRVTESNGDKFNSIVIPATGLVDFQQMISEMVAVAGDTPGKVQVQPTPQPVEESAPPQAPIETSAAVEPEPEPVKKPKTTKLKASTKAKAVRKKGKAAHEAEA